MSLMDKFRFSRKGLGDRNNLRSNNYIGRNNNLSNYISTNKSFLLLTFTALVFILTLQTISSIGITPGRTTINFEPGLQAEIPFSIINTEGKDMSVVFTVSGDLSESITLTQAFAEFSSSDDSKSFSYLINLPLKFDKPGIHQAEIIALELPKDIRETGAFVGATVAVVTQLYVNVPYPNKYLEGDVNVIESGEGANTIFLIPIVNRGKLDIGDARAIVDIYTILNEKIATIESESVSVKSLEKAEIIIDWPTDANPGRYLAVVTIIYDNEVLELRKEFNIGELSLEIIEVFVEDFELGGIAKFEALIENKWSNDLKDVFLNILVYNDEGETMADFKSPTYDLNALSKSELVAYWDTVGVKKGTYDGKLILRYGEKSIERNIALKITDFDIEIFGVTGRVIVKRGGTFNFNNLLVIVLVFLVIANIVWFVVVKRLLKKKR